MSKGYPTGRTASSRRPSPVRPGDRYSPKIPKRRPFPANDPWPARKWPQHLGAAGRVAVRYHPWIAGAILAYELYQLYDMFGRLDNTPGLSDQFGMWKLEQFCSPPAQHGCFQGNYILNPTDSCWTGKFFMPDDGPCADTVPSFWNNITRWEKTNPTVRIGDLRERWSRIQSGTQAPSVVPSMDYRIPPLPAHWWPEGLPINQPVPEPEPIPYPLIPQRPIEPGDPKEATKRGPDPERKSPGSPRPRPYERPGPEWEVEVFPTGDPVGDPAAKPDPLKRPRPREKPDPEVIRPRPRPRPGVDPEGEPGIYPRLREKPGIHVLATPARNVHEQKMRPTSKAYHALLGALRGITEALDLFEALYNAFPCDVRPRGFLTPYERAEWMAANMGQLDEGQFLVNVVVMEIQDRFIAWGSRKRQEVMEELGYPPGKAVAENWIGRRIRGDRPDGRSWDC